MIKFLMVGTALAVLVSGCADNGRYAGGPGDQRQGRYDGCSDNEAVGTVAGAIVGGVIGNQFGRGSGNTAATIGGALLGGIAGNAIARDSCRNDRADAYYYNQSYYDAFDKPEYGRRYEWNNPHSGNHGYVTPSRRVDARSYGYHDECRAFTETVFENGRSYDDERVACRMDDGRWQIVDR